jgi:hypothetical protein
MIISYYLLTLFVLSFVGNAEHTAGHASVALHVDSGDEIDS